MVWRSNGCKEQTNLKKDRRECRPFQVGAMRKQRMEGWADEKSHRAAYVGMSRRRENRGEQKGGDGCFRRVPRGGERGPKVHLLKANLMFEGGREARKSGKVGKGLKLVVDAPGGRSNSKDQKPDQSMDALARKNAKHRSDRGRRKEAKKAQ